jgi:hypothetical protein
MALIQEPLYRDGCVISLNIPGYIQYTAGGKDRPRACIPVMNMGIWVLPGFYCRDLVAVLLKCNEYGTQERLVVRSACLPYDSEDHPSSKGAEGTRAILRK